MHLIIDSIAFADSIPLFFLLEDLAIAWDILLTFSIPLEINVFLLYMLKSKRDLAIELDKTSKWYVSPLTIHPKAMKRFILFFLIL